MNTCTPPSCAPHPSSTSSSYGLRSSSKRAASAACLQPAKRKSTERTPLVARPEPRPNLWPADCAPPKAEPLSRPGSAPPALMREAPTPPPIHEARQRLQAAMGQFAACLPPLRERMRPPVLQQLRWVWKTGLEAYFDKHGSTLAQRTQYLFAATEALRSLLVSIAQAAPILSQAHHAGMSPQRRIAANQILAVHARLDDLASHSWQPREDCPCNSSQDGWSTALRLVPTQLFLLRCHHDLLLGRMEPEQAQLHLCRARCRGEEAHQESFAAAGAQSSAGPTERPAPASHPSVYTALRARLAADERGPARHHERTARAQARLLTLIELGESCTTDRANPAGPIYELVHAHLDAFLASAS